MERKKNKITQFLSNIFSFVIFSIIKILFPRNKREEKGILFINTGKIGDLMVSSMILENDDIFGNENIYLLIKEHYYPLFEKYSGKIKVLTYNYKSYKWSVIYRINFLKRLHKLKISKCYNVTSVRGMLNDEISLLSGARDVYTTCSNHLYLGKFIGKLMDKKYTKVLYHDIYNEYSKQNELLKSFSSNKELLFGNYKTFQFNNISKKKTYIAVSPFSTDEERCWSIEKYKILCNELSKSENIVMLGSENEIDKMIYLKSGNEKIDINTSPLNKVAELINNCKLYIGNHSGLTHIALKLNKPLVAIIDGGFFNQYLPYKTDNKNNVFIYNEMDCFGCLMYCIYKEKYCLTNITFEKVYDEVKKILNRV